MREQMRLKSKGRIRRRPRQLTKRRKQHKIFLMHESGDVISSPHLRYYYHYPHVDHPFPRPPRPQVLHVIGHWSLRFVVIIRQAAAKAAVLGICICLDAASYQSSLTETALRWEK